MTNTTKAEVLTSAPSTTPQPVVIQEAPPVADTTADHPLLGGPIKPPEKKTPMPVKAVKETRKQRKVSFTQFKKSAKPTGKKERKAPPLHSMKLIPTKLGEKKIELSMRAAVVQSFVGGISYGVGLAKLEKIVEKTPTGIRGKKRLPILRDNIASAVRNGFLKVFKG